MAASHSSEEDLVFAINITPFVDVVLVLLVTLMVTSTEIARSAMKVDLPAAASAGAHVPSTLNVIITNHGLMLDGRVVSETTLSSATKAARQSDPELRAVISADKSVPYEDVMRAIDIVKLAGVSRFALDVERSGS